MVSSFEPPVIIGEITPQCAVPRATAPTCFLFTNKSLFAYASCGHCTCAETSLARGGICACIEPSATLRSDVEVRVGLYASKVSRAKQTRAPPILCGSTQNWKKSRILLASSTIYDMKTIFNITYTLQVTQKVCKTSNLLRPIETVPFQQPAGRPRRWVPIFKRPFFRCLASSRNLAC